MKCNERRCAAMIGVYGAILAYPLTGRDR